MTRLKVGFLVMVLCWACASVQGGHVSSNPSGTAVATGANSGALVQTPSSIGNSLVVNPPSGPTPLGREFPAESAFSVAPSSGSNDPDEFAIGGPRDDGEPLPKPPAPLPKPSDSLRGTAPVVPAAKKPEYRDPTEREEPSSPRVLTKPLKSEGKRGKYTLTTPDGKYTVDRPGRAETIDYQFVKSGSTFTLEATKVKKIAGFKDAATWNGGAAERFLPDSPYFDDVNMGLPNNHHGSDHLPLDVKYQITNTLNGKKTSFSVKQFNILAERAAFFKNFQFAPMYREDGKDTNPTQPLSKDEYKGSGKNELLSLQKRMPVLKREMLDGVDGELPTIMTFEEVDNQPMWKEWLEGEGYTVLVQKRNFGAETIKSKGLEDDNRKDGNLIAFKSDVFEQVGNADLVDYDERIFKKKYERAALIVKLRAKDSGAEVVVGATHLSYDNVSDLGKRQQLNEATQFVEKIKAATDGGKIPAIMNGDFNSVPSSNVVTFVKEAGFTSAYADVEKEEPPATSAYTSSVYFEATPSSVKNPVETGRGA